MNPTNNSPDQRYTGSAYGPSLATPPVMPVATYPTSPSSPAIGNSTLGYTNSSSTSSLESSSTGLTPVIGMTLVENPLESSPQSIDQPLSSSNIRSDRFSPFKYNRKALLITTTIVSLMLVVGLATYFFGSHATKSSTTSQNSSAISSQYAVGNLPLSSLAITSQLKVGAAEQLTINGQLVVNDTVVLAPGIAPTTPLTGQFYYNKTTNQPYYYNGTTFVSLQPTTATTTSTTTPTPTTATNVCIQGATNCGFALAGSGVTTVNGLAGALTNVCIQNATNCGFALSGSGVTTVNGLASSLTIANATGTASTITIQDASTTQKGIAKFNPSNFTSTAGVIDTIQAITTTSDVQFASLGLGTTSTTGNLTLGTTGSLIANNLTHTGTGHDLVLNSGADNISFTNVNGANSFFFPTSGGTGQVICTSGITCATGAGQAVTLDPSGIQSSNSNLDAVAINKASGTGNVITLQAGGINAFTITSSGNTTISNTTTISSLHTNSLTPTSALTIGATTQSYSLQGNASSTISATNAGSTTTIGFITPTANVNYQFATATAGTYSICTTATVCSGYAPTTGSGSYAPITGSSNYLQLQATTPGSAQTGNSNITGTSIAGTFSGSGASLTSLNGTNVSSGTVADARLSANVPLLGATTQTFTGANTFSSASNSFTGNGAGLTSLNGTNITTGTVANAQLTTNVTLQGNTFNGVSQLVQTTAGGILPVISGANLTSLNATNISSGTLDNARLTTNVTLQGGTFNGANQLVQLNASSQLPAVSGALLTALNGTNITSGTVANAQLTANVTLQGNTFNGASQLLQLTAGGILPALSGTNITTLNGTNISSGTINDSRLSSNVALLNITTTQTFTGNLGIGSVGPVANFQVSQATTGIGTVSNTASGTTVTGIGTQFTNTFNIGDTVTIGGQTVAISAIASDTIMTTATITNANTNVAYTLTGGARLVVLGNGYVGIGTATPAGLLHVKTQLLTPVVTGGTLTSDATYYYRAFTGSGTFNVSGGPLTADVLLVAGGGGGGLIASGNVYAGAGGGGAGGLVYVSSTFINAGNSSVVVGQGGVSPATISPDTRATAGGNSSFGTLIVAIGGGRGMGSYDGQFANPSSRTDAVVGTDGGSSGGSSAGFSSLPPSVSGQGNSGGQVSPSSGAGGGGFSSAGSSPVSQGLGGSPGSGTSAYSSWASVTGTGASGAYAGGGQGGFATYYTAGGSQISSTGGGGAGAKGAGNPATSGVATSGGGGGGGGSDGTTTFIGGSGGSGVVIIRYLKTAVTSPVAVDALVVSSYGNVGIGTTTPTTGKLVVVGGPIDVSGNKIINLGTPTASTDAANKAYVDASSGMTLISTTTLSGASVTINSIPQTYKDLRVYIESPKPAVNAWQLQMQFNADGAANHHSTQSTLSTGTTAYGATQVDISNPSGMSSSVTQGFIVIDIYDYANPMTWKMGYTKAVTNYALAGGESQFLWYQAALLYNQTTPISSLLFKSASGNLTSGTLYLYGVK